MPSEGVSDGIFRGEMLQFAPFYRHRETGLCLQALFKDWEN